MWAPLCERRSAEVGCVGNNQKVQGNFGENDLRDWHFPWRRRARCLLTGTTKNMHEVRGVVTFWINARILWKTWMIFVAPLWESEIRCISISKYTCVCVCGFIHFSLKYICQNVWWWAFGGGFILCQSLEDAYISLGKMLFASGHENDQTSLTMWLWFRFLTMFHCEWRQQRRLLCVHTVKDKTNPNVLTFVTRI